MTALEIASLILATRRPQILKPRITRMSCVVRTSPSPWEGRERAPASDRGGKQLSPPSDERAESKTVAQSATQDEGGRVVHTPDEQEGSRPDAVALKPKAVAFDLSHTNT